MEEWRDIPGYPGYQASDLGRVRSVDRPVKYRASARAAGYKLGRLFGVNSGTICHIRDGRQYAHV